MIKFSFILVTPAALVALIFPETIINFLFGPRYLAATTALQILCLTAVLYTLLAITGTAIIGIGKPFIHTKVFLVMMGLNLIGNILLVPLWGIEGAAITTFFSYLIGFGLITYFARKLIKFPVPMISLLKTVVGALVTVMVFSLLKWIVVLPPLIELFVVMVPSFLLYAVWVLVTTLTAEDLGILREAQIPGVGLLTSVWRRLH